MIHLSDTSLTHNTTHKEDRAMNTELLNRAAKFLFENGAEMKNDEATRNAIIGLCIKTLVSSGMPMETAYDTIMGEGQYRKLAGDVWETLRAAAV